MDIKQLTEQYLEFLNLNTGYAGSSESSLVKIAHCWKSHVTAHMCFVLYTGKCQNFKVRGEPCSPLEKLNGQCGCGSGMTCQWVSMGIPPTIDSPIIRQGKRKIFHPPGPGSFQCAT